MPHLLAVHLPMVHSIPSFDPPSASTSNHKAAITCHGPPLHISLPFQRPPLLLPLSLLCGKPHEINWKCLQTAAVLWFCATTDNLPNQARTQSCAPCGTATAHVDPRSIFFAVTHNGSPRPTLPPPKQPALRMLTGFRPAQPTRSAPSNLMSCLGNACRPHPSPNAAYLAPYPNTAVTV